MSEPARCVWCKVAVEGQFELGAACPHCGRVPLLLEGIPEVREEHSYGNEPTKPPDLEGVGTAWRPTVLVTAPALWTVAEMGSGSHAFGSVYGDGSQYPIAVSAPAMCNSALCGWTGPLSGARRRR